MNTSRARVEPLQIGLVLGSSVLAALLFVASGSSGKPTEDASQWSGVQQSGALVRHAGIDSVSQRVTSQQNWVF